MKHLFESRTTLFDIQHLEAGFNGDFLAAMRAKPRLLTENLRQNLPALQAVAHFLRIALLKISRVRFVKGICLIADFDKADDIGICSINQTDIQRFPILHFLICGN